MQIKITRSDKRRKTVSARRIGDVLEILAPAHISDDKLQPIIARFQSQIAKKEKKKQLDNTELHRIATQLNKQYFQSKLQWESITWSTRQEKRYGSCASAQKTICISYRVASMPQFVKEYLVMHELAHLIEANHSVRFWQWVNKYPRTERARGYLMPAGLEGLDEPPSDIE